MRARRLLGATIVIALAGPAHASPPQGLVPVEARGGTLAAPGFTAGLPAAGWTWYRPEAPAGGERTFVAAPEDDSLRIVLSLGGESTAAQFVDVMKTIEATLRQAWTARGAQLGAFSYKEPTDFRGVLRFSTQAFHPVEGRRFIVGYVHLGRPTIATHAAFTSAEEPPQLRQVAASIRRSPDDAWPGDALQRYLIPGELVLVSALVAFLVYRSRRRPPSIGA